MEYLVTFEDGSSGYLAHHGVKGMKWGVWNEETKARRTGGSKFENTHMSGHMRFKARNGDVITLERSKPSVFVKTASKISPSFEKKQQDRYRNHSDFAMRVNGKRVGNIELLDKGNGELNGVWLSVNKKERGKGYGTAAMKNVLDYAKESGFSKFTLEVPGDSPDALHIYKKQGAKVVKNLTNSNDVWGGLTAMQVDLSRHNSSKNEKRSPGLNRADRKVSKTTKNWKKSLKENGRNSAKTERAKKRMFKAKTRFDAKYEKLNPERIRSYTD